MATQFHGRETFVSASLLLEVVSQQLSLMKDELKLTDEQLGRILGRSPDRAAEYRKGHAEIGLLAHSRAAQLWGEDYLNPWLAELGFKAVPLTAKCENDRAIPTRLCAATLVLQEAIEDDGELGPDNLRDARLRAAVERAGTTIDALRERFRASEATA